MRTISFSMGNVSPISSFIFLVYGFYAANLANIIGLAKKSQQHFCRIGQHHCLPTKSIFIAPVFKIERKPLHRQSRVQGLIVITQIMSAKDYSSHSERVVVTSGMNSSSSNFDSFVGRPPPLGPPMGKSSRTLPISVRTVISHSGLIYFAFICRVCII